MVGTISQSEFTWRFTRRFAWRFTQVCTEVYAEVYAEVCVGMVGTISQLEFDQNLRGGLCGGYAEVYLFLSLVTSGCP